MEKTSRVRGVVATPLIDPVEEPELTLAEMDYRLRRALFGSPKPDGKSSASGKECEERRDRGWTV